MSRKSKIRIYQTDDKIRDLKIQLCNRLKDACWRHGWSQEQTAIHLGTSRCCIHNVDGLKVDKLTVNQLFRYLACAAPGFSVLIAI